MCAFLSNLAFLSVELHYSRQYMHDIIGGDAAKYHNGDKDDATADLE